MNFKNQLKRELRIKGAACIVLEAIFTVAIMALFCGVWVLLGSMQA
jgi:hypothetical protein